MITRCIAWVLQFLILLGITKIKTDDCFEDKMSAQPCIAAYIDNLGNGVTTLSGEIGKISLYVVSALVKDP